MQRLFLLFSIEFEKTCIRLKQKLIFFVWHFSFLFDKNFQTVNHYPVTTQKFSRGLVTQALQLFGPWKVGPTEPWSHVQVANGLSPDCSSRRNIVTYKQMERILEGRWTLAFCQVCRSLRSPCCCSQPIMEPRAIGPSDCWAQDYQVRLKLTTGYGECPLFLVNMSKGPLT